MILISIAKTFGQGNLNPIGESQPNFFRKLLSNFTVSGSIGYGLSFHSHEISGVSLIQNKGQQPLLFDPSFLTPTNISVTYKNWIYNPAVVADVPVDTSSFLLGTDSIPVKFKALGHNIPINISIHYTFDRYRIGGGFSFEPYFIGSYKPNVFKSDIESFSTDFALSNYIRWYFLFGGEVFRTKHYMMVIDTKIGTYKLPKKQFNQDLITKGLFFNLGIRFERSLSEYVKVYVRPSIEYKSYQLAFPESSFSITNKIPDFYTNFGISWRLPNRKKCPISNCRTQIDHHHGGKVYRSRVHPFWKWQDPDYGENYPQLQRYKRKNRKRINPY